MSVSLNRTTIIKLVLTIGIPILLLLIPTNDVFTSQMRMAIAATALLLIWAACELTDLAVPSILWSAILVFTQTVDAATLYSSYVSMTFYGAISMMIFATVMARIGVLKRLAFWIAEKSGGTFGRLTFGVFFAVFGIAVATFTGGVIIAAAFVFGICEALGFIGKKEGAILTMTGILGIGTVRMFWTYPITVGAMQTSVQAVDPGFTLSFITLLKYNWPCFFFCLILIYIMLLITKTKNQEILGGKEYFRSELAKMGKMTRDEKIGIVALLGILIWVITNPIHGWDMMYGFCFFSMILFIPGIGVGKKEDFKGFPLGTLLFVMACMSIGSVCVAVGLVDAMKTILAPILSSAGSVWSLFIVLIAGALGNMCMTPMALLAGFSAMLYDIFGSIGMDPLAALFTWNYGCDLVFLPYEYTTPLLFMAFGTMTTAQFFKYNVLKNVVFLIFFGIIILPYWFLVGLL